LSIRLVHEMSADAGPSGSQGPGGALQELSPRQREKSRAVALDDVILDAGTIDHVCRTGVPRPALVHSARDLWTHGHTLTTGSGIIDLAVLAREAKYSTG
jgi:hypothetical protein